VLFETYFICRTRDTLAMSFNENREMEHSVLQVSHFYLDHVMQAGKGLITAVVGIGCPTTPSFECLLQ